MYFSALLSLLASTAAVSAVGVPARRDAESNQVLTPAGYKDASNVLQVPDGAHISRVGENFHVVHPDGSLFATVPAPKTEGKAAVLPEQTGWITYGSWVNPDTSNPIAKFTTDFVVPPAPATYTEQTVFLFPGLCPSDGTTILQPVLQGGGEYWAVAMWYVTETTYFVSSLVPVSAGDSLEGVMSLTGYDLSTSSFNYTTSMPPLTPTLNVNLDVQLVWGTLTLEAYSIENANSYPVGTTTWSDVYLELADGSIPTTPQWSTIQDTADGITTTFEVNAFDGTGEATIKY
ncbi:hypothetical protein HMN09_00267500 [Mycena chlorophos]|uniref:Concanavalin A-like lectin/glucanase n=1 Tax=Mycena chlorophos TaxID=658473 RepID=A0A8H6TP96_MYCCL|nr:hypothetical protein HMN09_00267500 [Mycena chlorophos]